MCRGSSDPAFSTQLGEKAGEAALQGPTQPGGSSRKSSASHASLSPSGCVVSPLLFPTQDCVLPQAAFFEECSPRCTPNDTVGWGSWGISITWLVYLSRGCSATTLLMCLWWASLLQYQSQKSVTQLQIGQKNGVAVLTKTVVFFTFLPYFMYY